MGLCIRVASLDDAKGIVEVYCSSVNRWVRFVDGNKVEAKYEDLTVEERFAHGGPWMSIETCAININNLLISGQYPLVAELDGKIVGELELYICEEEGILGKYGFIDVLEVHKDYRRKGVGRALVNKAAEISRQHGCESLVVWLAKEAVGFYKKCGLDKIVYNIICLEIDLEKESLRTIDSSEICSFPEKYDKELLLISPRIFPSFVAWLKCEWRYSFAEKKITSTKGCISNLDTAHVIENLWYSKNTANVFLWTRDVEKIPNAVDIVLGVAKYAGFNKARLYVDENTYQRYLKRYCHKVISNEILLTGKIG